MIHPTAIIDPGAVIGKGTFIWDNTHVRSGAVIGDNSIIGEKTHVAYDVRIGNRCKVQTLCLIAPGVTLEDGVFVGPGVIFTNDRFPRAVTPDLSALLSSDAPDDMPRTLVREGTAIGGNATIGPGITIGRWAMVGMGSVVTRNVADFHLVIGNPAKPVGAVCRCGHLVIRFDAKPAGVVACPACPLTYSIEGLEVHELNPPSNPAPAL